MGGGRGEIRARLAALAGAECADLAGTALDLAALDCPRADRAQYESCLERMAGDLAGEAGTAAGAGARAAALSRVLAGRHRFRGDDGDACEGECANLMAAIDRRRGSAEALGILYLETARRLGWTVEGLSFPVHFLLRLVGEDGSRVVVDPLCGGRTVEVPAMRSLLKAVSGNGAELRPGLYATLTNRAILVRLQNDAKVRFLRCGRLDRAVEVVEATLLFAPDQTPLWREAGLMHMRLDRLPQAVAALEQFVARTGNEQARRRTQQLLHELKDRLR